ncbi:MAG: bifunctional hydroxymethylpyrimidine kinase/phosphomethylpyrimidine kinase [Desulfuromonadaceae bacterium]|nr:bifunctional hydroxymethylpyrimidine kinase/phosphomethylpyrimidine kinase [Desulfuromonadaceae bacterium]
MISGLYAITDGNRDGRLVARVGAALRGGARMVQYREKEGTDEERIAIARELKELCQAAGALLIVNDSPALALACQADGVHLGQQDMAIAEARAILGRGKIIGVSTRTVELARKAEQEGADYIGVGAMFPTGTKSDAIVIGPQKLAEIRREVKIPIVAIGGISRDNASEVLAAGADVVAVVSALMQDPDPTLAAREFSLLFNSRLPYPRGRVLTIAGSDSGGGAGIQADLKTATLLGSFGMSAITALTAQNTLGVTDIHPAPPEFIAAQIEAVLSDIGADVIKVGMLFSPEIIRLVAANIRRYALPAVVDPVMIAKGGASLLREEAVAALRQELLPLAYLITPNIPEAEVLTGLAIRTESDMEKAAARLCTMGPRNVLVKGGHLEGDSVDLLVEGGRLHRFHEKRFDTPHTHGTGCTYSAAIATFLAQGIPLVQAVQRGKIFITEAIRHAPGIGHGHGPVNHFRAALNALNLTL